MPCMIIDYVHFALCMKLCHIIMRTWYGKRFTNCRRYVGKVKLCVPLRLCFYLNHINIFTMKCMFEILLYEVCPVCRAPMHSLKQFTLPNSELSSCKLLIIFQNLQKLSRYFPIIFLSCAILICSIITNISDLKAHYLHHNPY